MVNILMATYNGGAYIKEQISSILAQTYLDWRLYIRDDGSSDNTRQIIAEMADDLPQKVVIIKDGEKQRLGAKRNFSQLLEKCEDADFYFFCDQDDVWEKDKLAEMLKAVSTQGAEQPILAYHDMRIIDKRGGVLSESLYGYSGIKLSEKHPFEQLLTHNTVPGCALMINRELKNIIKRIPDKCIIHDWWLVLSAYAVGGKVIHVNKVLSNYRIHEHNQVGIRKKTSLQWILQAISTRRYRRYRQNNRDCKKKLCDQIDLLFLCYRGNIAAEAERSMKRFVKLVTEKKGPVSLFYAYKYGYMLTSRLETAKFYLL